MTETPKVNPEGGVPLEEAIRWVSLPRADGRDQEEEEEAVPLLVDVSELAPAEYREHGIGTRAAARVADARTTARVWLTHSEVSTRYPKEDKVARASARNAAAFWWKKHGTLDGLMLHRTFPCLGKFRVVNEAAETGPIVVVCDVCGHCFGVDREEFQAALDATLV